MSIAQRERAAERLDKAVAGELKPLKRSRKMDTIFWFNPCPTGKSACI
jgi:hypothetical protein